MELKRIMADEVVRRYKELGWRPEQGEWVRDKPNGTRCGCGLGVMIGDGIEELFGRNRDKSIYTVVSGALGLPGDYVVGFAQGFDGPLNLNSQKRRTNHFRTGYEDGRAAWEAARREVLGDVGET